MSTYVNYNETSIANLEVAQDMGKNDYFLIQPQDFNNKAKILPFRNMIIGLDNVSFAKTITDNSTKINELSSKVLSLSGHTVPATNITGIIQPNQYIIGNKTITGSNIANNTIAIEKLTPDIRDTLNAGVSPDDISTISELCVKLNRQNQQYIDYVIGSDFKNNEYNSNLPGNDNKNWFRQTTYFRLYRSGWLEQGGTFLTKSVDNTDTLLTFDIPFNNINFIFVCNPLYSGDGAYGSEFKDTDSNWYNLSKYRTKNSVTMNRCVSISWQACGIIAEDVFKNYIKKDLTINNNINYDNNYTFPETNE